MANAQHQIHLKNYLKNHKDGVISPEAKTQSVRKKDNRPAADSSPSQSNNTSKPSNTTTRRQRDGIGRRKLFSSKMAYSKPGKVDMDCLPEEIILEIFEYLSPQDLLSCARVCKRWRGLACDNLLWQDIYKHYATKTSSITTPKRQNTKTPTSTLPKSPPSNYWKSICIQKGSDFRNDRAMKLLEKKKQPLSPFTGLPKATQEALTKSGVKWVLCFVDADNNDHSVFHNDAFHFSMSVCVRWYDFSLPSIHRIRKLRIYSGNPIFFDDHGNAQPNSPLQRSLLYENDFKLGQITSSSSPLGTDEIINVFNLPDGITVATWKDGRDLAFITVSFHADCLVQRCLLGKGSLRWMPPPHKVLVDDIDPKYGLHSSCCTLELRNMRNSFWSQQFMNLYCLEEFKDNCGVIQLINPERSFERSWLEKKISMPWKTEALKGIVKDICFLDLTVLDDQRRPMWCSSGMVKITRASEDSSVTYEYDGDYFVIKFQDPCGKVEMILIWEEESKKYFITSLQLHVSLQLISKWYGRQY